MSDVSFGNLTAFTTWSPFGPRPVAPVVSAPLETRIPQNLASFTNWMPFGVSNEFDCRPRYSTIFVRVHQTCYLIRMLRTHTQDQNGSSSFVEGVPIQVLGMFPGSMLLSSPSVVKSSAGSDAVFTSRGPLGVSSHLTANQNSESSSDSGNFSSLDSCSSSRTSISDNAEGQGSSASVQCSANQDPWIPKVVFPSSKFPSMSINPIFNIWSPSSDDDMFLDALAYPSNETDSNSSNYLRQRKDSDTSNTASSISASDLEEWGAFSSWSHVPTLDEAEILLAQQKAKKEVVKVCCKIVYKKSVQYHWRNYIKTKMRSRRKVRSS